MKTITWIQLLIFCAGIGQFRAATARDVRPRESDVRTKQQVLPTDTLLMKGAEQILRFDKNILNIGTLTEDDALQTYRFNCTNVSKKTVVLTRVSTTCGCTVADVQTGSLLPGETRTIALTYNPKNHPGTIDADAFVYLSSSDKIPAARLTLTGNVLPSADEWARYPYAAGKLRMKQNRMEFNEVITGKRYSERILCGNSGDKPLKLSALIIPKFATFRTEPEVILPGSEADIVVTVDANLIPEGKGSSFSFPVIIEGIDVRPSDRTLNIKVNRIK